LSYQRDTQAVAEKLVEDGYSAAALHGDLSQAQRDGVMKSFEEDRSNACSYRCCSVELMLTTLLT
jgi:superfamily II DNA/RNA helicase